MKKIVAFMFGLGVSLLLMATFTSCSKDDDDESSDGKYYIRFKANGTQIEYSNQLLLTAAFGQSEQFYVVVFSGANDASSNISLQIHNDKPITEGSYSGYSIMEGTPKGVIIGYLEKSSNVIFSSGGGPGVEANIKVSELTGTHVKGEFSGVVKSNGRDDITISDGTFFVWRVKATDNPK
jgi:hypothetical protein